MRTPHTAQSPDTEVRRPQAPDPAPGRVDDPPPAPPVQGAWRVPLTDIAMPEEDVQAVLACLRSGWLTMGPRTAELERELAAYLGAPHTVAVSSGTAALHLACAAAGLGPGDEVLVPAFTFVASASAARMVGAEPVLCDIRGDLDGRWDLNIDVADAAARLTPPTRAVVAVHFGGYPADVRALVELCAERGLVLIEDCAEAIGARVEEGGRQVGTLGTLGAYSFFSKNQLCVGEGGAVCTADEALAARVRLLRSHALTSSTWDRHRGHDPAYDVVDVGFNYRLDEPRAALGLSRLARLRGDLAIRRALVRAYRERLAEVPGVELLWDESAVELSSHFLFPVLLPDRSARDRLRAALAAAGVQTTWYPALHTFTEYRDRAPAGGLPRALEASERHCVLPLSATMDERDVEVVVEAVRGAGV
jgi:dTDP-4-amino-4,6-dideoxygalactose transaminase